jgi:adenylate kinase
LNALAGIKVESTIRSGGLVSDDLILRLITNELNKRGWLFSGNERSPPIITLASAGLAADGESGSQEDAEVAAFLGSPLLASNFAFPQASDEPSASFLLDGFPRTAAQADRLDEIVPINMAVSIKTPFEVLLERISGRWLHEASGRIYNTGFNAPQKAGFDDVTGDPLVRRPDDDEAVYKARFKQFQDLSAPLLEHYAEKGVLWEVEGLTSDEISPKLYQEFERRFT